MKESVALAFLLILVSCASMSPDPWCDEFEIPLPDDLHPPRRLEMLAPEPPRDGSVRGFACVHATITSAGRVVDPVVVRTDNPAFAQAFLQALESWRYEPAVKDGLPTDVRVLLSSQFHTSESTQEGWVPPSRQ